MAEVENIIVIPEGKIRDYIDGKFRKDTPEEYVRQNTVPSLSGTFGIPAWLALNPKMPTNHTMDR